MKRGLAQAGPLVRAAAPGDAAFATLAQAAEWFAVLRSGKATAAEIAEWHAWRAAGAEQQVAWQRVEAISGRLTLPERLSADQREAAQAALGAAAAVLQRRKALRTLGLAAGVGALGWAAVCSSPMTELVAVWRAEHRTATGEMRAVELADGTRLMLGTDSAIDVHFGEALRRIVLYQGELFIDTAPDSMRPARALVVDTAAGRLRALGTRFNVRLNSGATHLAVFDGRVEVSPAGTAAQTFAAGQQVRFTSGNIGPARAAEPAREAWVRGVLLADEMPLGRFIEELARYRSGHLACDPAVAQLRVVGGYPLANTDQALAMLQAALPVRVHAALPWWVTVTAR